MPTSYQRISILSGITNDIKQLVKDCDTCNKYQAEQPKYLMIVDYYSRFPVIRLVSDMSAETICTISPVYYLIMVYHQSSLLMLVLNTSVKSLKIIVQRVESQLHLVHPTTIKQVVCWESSMNLQIIVEEICRKQQVSLHSPVNVKSYTTW